MPEEIKADINLPVNEKGKTILDALKEMMGTPAFQEKMAEKLVAKRPAGTSTRSSFSYYRPQFAIEMKLVIDKMMQDKKDQIFLYKDSKLSKNSLYLRVWQSLRYLMDNFDQDGKYKVFRDSITVQRIGTGVAILFVKAGVNFTPKDYVGEDKPSTIMEEIRDFLDDDSKKIFSKNVTLMPEDIRQINESLQPLESVVAAVTHKEIRIVKQ